MKKYIPFILIIVFTIPSITFAAKYELAICVVDEPESHRKKEGDILAIKRYPCNWGYREIGSCLIVIIESARSYEFLDAMISQSVYRDKINSNLLLQDDYDVLTRTRSSSEFELAYQSRFQISHAKIKAKLSDLDLTKVRNKLTKYQPFKSASQLIQAFDGKNGNRLLKLQDVDCVSSMKVDKNTEFSINLDAISAIILDKYTGALVKP